MKFRDILENTDGEQNKPPFQPSPLPYSFSDLEPHIDRETMEEHYERHYKGYVKKLNTAFEDTPHLVKPLEEILQNISSYPIAVRNNGGGVHNHNHLWEILKPGGSNQPKGELALFISRHLGGVDGFKKRFKEEGLKRFGSGWVWLSKGEGNELKIHSTPNQDSPLMEGWKPIIGCDVWEHAYYLRWKSNREGWLDTFLEIINWDVALKNFKG